MANYELWELKHKEETSMSLFSRTNCCVNITFKPSPTTYKKLNNAHMISHHEERYNKIITFFMYCRYKCSIPYIILVSNKGESARSIIHPHQQKGFRKSIEALIKWFYFSRFCSSNWHPLQVPCTLDIFDRREKPKAS